LRARAGAPRIRDYVEGGRRAADELGVALDRTAIDWARDHLSGIGWTVTSFEPPLPFEGERFDLVYAISVLSHLGSGLQQRWLAELHRVLAPGGVAALSIHGPHAFEQFRAGRVRTSWSRPELFRRGSLAPSDFVFAPYVKSVWNRGELPGIGREYGLTFQGPDQVGAVWSQELRVLAVRERAMTDWQDMVICARAG
jgi:SAM-dependent methyltransferase